jgi:hypothetical protein
MGQFGSRGGLRKMVPLKPNGCAHWIERSIPAGASSVARPLSPKEEKRAIDHSAVDPKSYAEPSVV